MNTENIFAVFTKPWASHSASQLAAVVQGIGFEGIELPVRENSFVTPASAERSLAGYVSDLRERGVETVSVATELSERAFAACHSAQVPVIRVMAPVDHNDVAGSLATLGGLFEQALAWSVETGIKVAVQPHRGPYLTNCFALMELLCDLPPENYTIAWDAAHDALAGEDPRVSLGLVAPRLSIANFKNARYVATPASPGSQRSADWDAEFVAGQDGLADWALAVKTLISLGFDGPLCLSAQYSSTVTSVEELLRHDLDYLRRLKEQAQ